MIARNIAFNSISRFINLFSHFFFIPIYIYFLGIEGYAVVGIYVVLFSFLTFTDFGMTATLTRQMALNDIAVNKKTIFNTFELCYLVICFCLFLVGSANLDQISSNFFNESEFFQSDTRHIFFLIILTLTLQLPSSIYIGALMGLEQQFTANILISIAAISRGALATLFLYLDSSLISFFYSQILINFLYFLALRVAVLRNMKDYKNYKRFALKVIKNNFKFSSNMAILSILGIIFANIDKLLVANLLPLKEVGIYTLAFNLSMLPTMLCQIVAISSYPSIIKEAQSIRSSNFKKFYSNINSLMASLLVPLSLTLIFFNNHVSFAWVGDMQLSKDIYFYSIILIAAQTVQGTTMLAYYFALSRGVTLPQILIASFSLIIIVPGMYFSIGNYGLFGASMTLFFCMIIVYPFGVIYLNKNHENVSLSSYSVTPYIKTFMILVPLFLIISFFDLDPFSSRYLNILILALIFVLGIFTASIINYSNTKDYILELRGYLKKINDNKFL